MRGGGFVGDVVGHAGAEGELGAVLMFDDDLAGDDEHDVALAAPVVGDVFAAVVHEAKLDVAEFADARGGGAGFAHMSRRWEFGPIDGAGGKIVELHRLSRCGESGPRFRRGLYHKREKAAVRGVDLLRIRGMLDDQISDEYGVSKGRSCREQPAGVPWSSRRWDRPKD